MAEIKRIQHEVMRELTLAHGNENASERFFAPRRREADEYMDA